MVRMALQMKGEQVREDVVGVPRMARLAGLVAPVRALLAKQPIVLDVVRLRQAVPADEVMRDDERRDFPAKNGDEHAATANVTA